MKTAIELAASLSARYLDTKQMLPDELAHEAAAMLLQQAEQIEALTKMLVISDDTHQTWMKENSPGGWIDDLRKENESLLKANLDCFDNFNTLKADYDALQSELSRAKNDLADALDCKNGMGPTALGTVLKERDALKADAERYQWLSRNPTYLGWDADFEAEFVDFEVDKAIDAMKGKS